jgi:hypothetical protein
MILIEYSVCNNLHGNRVNSLARLSKEYEISDTLLEFACQKSEISSKDLLLYNSQQWPLKLIELRETKDNDFDLRKAKVVLEWPHKLQQLFFENKLSYQEAKELTEHDYKPFEGMALSTLVAFIGPPHQLITVDEVTTMNTWQSEQYQVICTVTGQTVTHINQEVQALINLPNDEGI